MTNLRVVLGQNENALFVGISVLLGAKEGLFYLKQLWGFGERKVKIKLGCLTGCF